MVYLGDPAGGFCSGTLITSTWALTARHCTNGSYNTGRPTPSKPAGVTVSAPNNQVWVGYEHPRPTGAPPGTSRATRTIVDVVPYGFDIFTGFYQGGMDYMQIARDIALVKFWPPVTTEAVPTKPSFLRPPHSDGTLGAFGELLFFGSYISGGIAGYGLDLQDPLLGTGFYPPYRKNYEVVYPGFYIYASDVGTETGNYPGVVGAIFNVSPDGAPHQTWSGDSGGPLYRVGSNPGVRDVVGVTSGDSWYTDWCEFLGFCDDESLSWFADIAAPGARNFIESVMDPDHDGRWDGEVDYPRTNNVYGQSPADSCDLTNDPDCDLVLNINDNCPGDWNPDQLNTDKDHFGDVCDQCVIQKDWGQNCNSDAEQLHYPPRVPVTEEAALLGPYPPPPDDFHRSDICDPAACMYMGSEAIELPAEYGAPDPSSSLCLIAAPQAGGRCAFTAQVKIARDGVRDVPVTGDTSYRFCECDASRANQQDRLTNCFGLQVNCERDWDQFPGDPDSHELTSTSFSGIPNGEGVSGTLADTFDGTGSNLLNPFVWDFRQDYNTIKPGSPVSFPLTEATLGDVALDGLVWATVRRVAGTAPLLALRNLHQSWLPIEVRVNGQVVGGSAHKWVIGAPWYHCWGPNCQNGLSKPWLWGVDPQLGGDPLIELLTESSSLPIDTITSPEASELLQQVDATDFHLISASEPSFLFGEQSSARPVLAVVSSDLGIQGLVAHASTETTEFVALSTDPVDAPSGGSALPANIALSATQGRLYAVKAVQEPELWWSDGTADWVPMEIAGQQPVDPQALVYNFLDKSLYLSDRDGDTRRILRLKLIDDGQVESSVLWESAAGTPEQVDWLSVDHSGRVILTVLMESSYRVVALEKSDQCTPGGLRAAAGRSGTGELLAPPVADPRGWYSALHGESDPVEYHQDPEAEFFNDSVNACDVDWVFAQ